MNEDENKQEVSSWGWTIAALLANALVVAFFLLRLRRIGEMTGDLSLGHYAGVLVVCLPLLYPLWRLWAKRSKPWGGWTKTLVVFTIFYAVFAELHGGTATDLMLKRYQQGAKSGLGNMRTALSEYIRKNGVPPEDLSGAVPVIPRLILPYTGHKGTHGVRVSDSADIRDTGKWLYVKNGPSSGVLIDCTHKYDRYNSDSPAWSAF